MVRNVIPEHILANAGEVGQLLRNFNWSTTALGTVEAWSEGLWTAVILCLSSRLPSVILWGTELIQIYNDGYRIMLGDRHPEALGQALQTRCPAAWQADQSLYQAVLSEGQVIYRENQRYVAECDGQQTERCFTVSYSPIYSDQQIDGILVAVLQATQLRTTSLTTSSLTTSLQPTQRPQLLVRMQESDLRESDLQESEQLRQLAESIASVFWLFDLPTQQLLYVSPAYEQIWGRPRADLYADYTRWREFIHPEDRQQMKLAATRCLANGSNQEIYRVMQPDGSMRWIRDRGFVVYDAVGQPYRLAGVAEDITEQIALESERDQLLSREQAARAEAERANRIKDEFLAMLSHEIRTPLTPILGWARLLKSSTLNAKAMTEALNAIERNAQMQVQLIDDLFDISAMLQGKLSLQLDTVDLSEVIAAALETIQPTAAAKRLDLRPDLPRGCCFVSGDATRLQQVVWNLLSNAVKFTPEGGEIWLKLTEADNLVQLQVRDSGKGICPSFLPHVFEQFRQEDGSNTRRFGGLGLGLAIVRQIVELHDGTVTADSPGEGQGASFTVRLPLLRPEQLASPPRLSSTASEDLPLAGLRIMVVDDEPDTRQLVAFVVRQAGAGVVATPSAREALQAFQTIQPDVLISDIGMPEMNGYGLVREIQALFPNRFTAIALTAYAAASDQQQALESGFHGHIAKPVKPDMLIKAIRDLIERQQS